MAKKLIHFTGIHSKKRLSMGSRGCTKSTARTAFPRQHFSWDLKGAEWQFWWSSGQKKELAVQRPKAKESLLHLGTCQSFRMNECRKWWEKKNETASAKSPSKLQSASWAKLSHLTFVLRAGFPKVWLGDEQEDLDGTQSNVFHLDSKWI